MFPSELLAIIAHYLSVPEVDTLALCSRRLYRTLHPESYWYDRARHQEVTQHWKDLHAYASWYELYHSSLTLTTLPPKVACLDGEDYNARDRYDGMMTCDSLVMCYKHVAWNIHNELVLIDITGKPLCNLTQMNVCPRVNNDGSLAINVRIFSYKLIAMVFYIDCHNELRLFIMIYLFEEKRIAYKNIRLLDRVHQAVCKVDSSTISFSATIYRLDGTTYYWFSDIFTDIWCHPAANSGDLLMPGKRLYLSQHVHPYPSMRKILRIEDMTYFLTSDRCYGYINEEFMEEFQADDIDSYCGYLLIYNKGKGWHYPYSHEDHISIETPEPDLVIHGIHLYYREGKLFSLQDYIIWTRESKFGSSLGFAIQLK